MSRFHETALAGRRARSKTKRVVCEVSPTYGLYINVIRYSTTEEAGCLGCFGSIDGGFVMVISCHDQRFSHANRFHNSMALVAMLAEY